MDRADFAELDASVVRYQMRVPALIGVVAVGCAVAMYARRAVLRYAGMAAMTGLLVIESLALALPLLPNEDTATLYPDTPSSRFLDQAIGDGRMAAEGRTFFGNATMMAEHRSVTGHAFHATTWKEALLTIDPHAFDASGTFSMLQGTLPVATSPFLDRLGTNIFATVPDRPPLGRRAVTGLAQDSCERGTTLDGTVQQVPVPPGGGLRGVVLQVCDEVDLPPDAALVGRVVSPAGTAEGRLELPDTTQRDEMALAIPAEHLTGDVAVMVELQGADGRTIPVSATPTGQLAADAVQANGDGLRLVFAHDLLVYERTKALPRIRWASGAMVVPDLVERLTVLAHGQADEDTVVLDHEVADGDGRPAQVEVTEDGPTAISARVDAQGDGFLVVADSLQSGWNVHVDGEDAELLAADHAGVAVRVPEGRHTVTLSYQPGGWRLGQALSVLAALGLAGAAVWDIRRRRRGGAVGSGDRPDGPATHLARSEGNRLRLPLPNREPTSKT
jgi:Bacterial membrane protein YfhO